MNGKELKKLLTNLAEMAYNEGREHQLDDNCPDVGMYFPKTFKDTTAYKLISIGTKGK